MVEVPQMHPIEALRWISQWDLADPVGLCQEAGVQLARAADTPGLLVSACRQLVRAAPIGPVYGLAAAALTAFDVLDATEQFVDQLTDDPVWERFATPVANAVIGRRTEIRSFVVDPTAPTFVLAAASCGSRVAVVERRRGRRDADRPRAPVVVVVGRHTAVGESTWAAISRASHRELHELVLPLDARVERAFSRGGLDTVIVDVAEVPELVRP